MTERGDSVQVTSRTGSARRFVGDLKKVRELNTRRQTRRLDFWSSQTQGELAPYGGCSRWGPNEWDSIEDCVSPPYVETFNSKLIKKVSYLNKQVVMCFRISRFLCSLCVLSLWTFYVYFAHGVNSGYSTQIS